MAKATKKDAKKVIKKEQTLIILKPDSIQRGLIGEILLRFERAGIKIVAMKMMHADLELLTRHYPDTLIPVIGGKTKKDWESYGVEHTETAEEIGQLIVAATREFMNSTPVVAVVLEGDYVVEIVRKMVGSTGPKDSLPGTIRGDYAHLSLGQASLKKKGAANLIHASGSPKEAREEIDLWFNEIEIFNYHTTNERLTHA